MRRRSSCRGQCRCRRQWIGKMHMKLVGVIWLRLLQQVSMLLGQVGFRHGLSQEKVRRVKYAMRIRAVAVAVQARVCGMAGLLHGGSHQRVRAGSTRGTRRL